MDRSSPNRNRWCFLDSDNGFEFFDERESIPDDIAAQVGRRTGWSSRSSGVVDCGAQAELVESFTELGDDKKRAAELQAIKDRIEEGRDVFRKTFYSQQDVEAKRAEKKLSLYRQQQPRIGVFCTFKDDPLFLKTYGCLIKFIPATGCLHVIGIKTMGVLASGVREISEGENFQIHKIPPIFHRFHHVSSFYKNEEEAKLLLDRCQAL